MSHFVLIDHFLGGLTRISKWPFTMGLFTFSFNLITDIFSHRVARSALEHVELLVDNLVQLVLLLLALHPFLASDSFTQMIMFRFLMCSFLLLFKFGTYRIDRVYPRRAKSACSSSSSTNASIVHTFLSRFILIVTPVFLLRMCDVSMPVRSSWSKITR